MNKNMFLCLFLVFVSLACGTPKESTVGVSISNGVLRIVCQPSDAEVFIDEISMGEANIYDGEPGYIKLERGTHTIEIRKEGYAPYVQEVDAGQSLQTLEVTLRRLE